MTGTMKNKPAACCCGEPCDPLDTFTGPIEVTDASVTTIRSKQHPQSPYPMWLTVEVKVDAGAIASIFWLWDDASPGDGLYLEFEPDAPTATSGTITVYRKDGIRVGDPWFVVGAVSDEWHVFTICYDPDTSPEEMVITVDPAGSTYAAQSLNVLLPSGMSVGRKAGYGTGSGSGSVWFQNYSFERLWYCGNGTEDCHELGDDWDSDYELPDRTYCRTCTRCPAGPRATVEADWNVLSGTWTFSGVGAATDSSNAKIVSYGGQATWQANNSAAIYLNYFTTNTGDEGLIGMSDAIGRNQLYIMVSKAVETAPAAYRSVPVGVWYDEARDRFYWWIARAGSAAITYKIYRVTDGGSPSLEIGPITVSPTNPGGGNVVLADGYVTIHATMRNHLIGTGANGSSNGQVIIGGTRNQCACGGGVGIVPRKFSAVVSGISVGSDPIREEFGVPPVYADVSRLNRSATLRNYYHLTPGTPFAVPCNNCCHSDWVIDTGSRMTWFTYAYVGGYTELYGYAYMQQPTSIGLVTMQVTFRKSLFGIIDVRDLDGEVLEYDSYTHSLMVGDYIDGTGATFTIRAIV